jgi:MFS family permease
VFLAHYLSNNIFPGATTLDFAFIGGLSISQALLISPLATIATRKYGTQVTLLVGVFFETLSLIGASFTKEIWQLFLSQGLCFGWGMGFLFVGSVGVTPQWFTKRRSFANGIAASGSGVGGLTYSLATNAMIQRIGLGWAFRVLGICSFVVNTFCALLIKDRNKKIGTSHRGFDYTLLRRKEFLMLLAFGFLSMLGYIVLLFSLPNYASSIGLSAHQGSVVGALLNLGQAMGRPPIGFFSDAVGRINMAATMTFLAGLFSLVIWTNAHSYGVTLFFALIGGTVAGTYWAIVAPVTAEVMGLVDLPAALSITWVVLAIPTTFSEAIALQITATNGGNYLGAQLFTGFMYIGAAALMWWVRVWKIGELERVAAESAITEKMAEVQSATNLNRTSYAKKWIMVKKV